MNGNRIGIWAAACLALAIAAMSLGLAAPGVAEAHAGETVYSYEAFSRISGEAQDNDALFEGYVGELFGLPGMRARAAKQVGRSLAGVNALLYSELKWRIADVAAGVTASTAFDISLGSYGGGWTAAELGVDSIVVNGSISDEAAAALDVKLGLDTSRVIDALLADCAYELYWYDKVAGLQVGTRYSVEIDRAGELKLKVDNMAFYLSVAGAYAAGEYAVDVSLAQGAVRSAERAKEIIAQYAGATDYDKLFGYRQAICDLVTYNHEAADNEATPYGDPWQLIWVFDGDADTNVVCEGYSKAFQYLCDMTEFNGNVVCYTVTGWLFDDSDDEPGRHMWNIVTMPDGANYLVDVTNSDPDSAEEGVYVFLAGYMRGSASDAYFYDFWGSWLGYAYDESAIALYPIEDLEISDHDYDPSRQAAANPHLSVTNASVSAPAGEDGYALGETITYRILLKNDGDVRLTDVRVRFVVAEDPASPDARPEYEWTVDSLPSGENQVFEAVYAVTEADILAGNVVAGAHAAAVNPEDPEGEPVMSGWDAVRDGVEPAKAALLAEIGVNNRPADGSLFGLDDVIAYGVSIRNTGNVTLGDIAVEDDVTGFARRVDRLAPGESVAFEIARQVTRGEVLCGFIDFGVTAGADDPAKPGARVETQAVSIEDLAPLPDWEVENGALVSYNGSDVDVVIPETLGITAIEGAFASYAAVETVVIPDGVARIGADSFRRCMSLRAVVIPASVVDIDPSAFQEDGDALVIRGFSGSPARTYARDNGIAFMYLDEGEKLAADLVLPAELRIIEREAFEGGSFTAVKPGGALERIDARAFADCEALVQIELPESVTDIAGDAFDGCGVLTIICPEGSAAQAYAKLYGIDCVVE